MDFFTSPFRSPQPRKPDPALALIDPSYAETTDQLRRNNEFPLSILAPADSPSGTLEFVIMINGFGQSEMDLFDNSETGLRQLLSQRGVASVFMPLPMHFERMPVDNVYVQRLYRRSPRLVPFSLCAVSKERLYYGYSQVVADVLELSRLLLDGTLLPHLRTRIRLHLLGYSLGGLAALAAFLLAHMRSSNVFDSCTLLSSGASLKQIVPEGLHLSPERLQALREFYEQDDLSRFEIDKESDEFRVFSYVALDTPWLEIIDDVKNQVFVLSGEKDEVNPVLPAMARAVTTFPAHLLPDLTHELQQCDAWRSRWAPYAVLCIVNFLRNHPRT